MKRPALRVCVALVLLAVGGIHAAVAAPSAEPARVRVATALLDETVARHLPLEVVWPALQGSSPDAGVEGPPQAALLTELRYCGPTERGSGRLRAVVRWGALGTAPAVLTGADACRQALGDLARQVRTEGEGASDAGAAVVDLEATWRPWELKLSLVRAVTPPAPSPPRPSPPRPLAAVEVRRDLLTLQTSGLRLVPNSGEPQTLNVAVGFVPDGLELGALVAADGAGAPDARLVASGGAPPLQAGSNVAIDLSHATANQLLRQVGGAGPIAVPVERDVIDVQDLSIAPAGATAVVTGNATPRSLRETARLTVVVGGAELKVLSLRADAQLENCGALGALAAIACNTRNAARNTVAALATAASQKYQGRLVREVAGAQSLSLDVATVRLSLSGELVRTTLGPRGLLLWGRLSPGGGGH